MADALSTAGFSALTSGAGLVDLSTRGRIRVTGEDRARLLHAMTTNHVQQLKPGEGLYAFFLNAQGRIQADAYILCFEEHLLLDTEPETRQTLFEHLDKFIIADDVTLEDTTDETVCLSLEGPGAAEVASDAGFPVPEARFSHTDSGSVTIATVRGLRFYAAVSRRDEIAQKLGACGAVAVSAHDAELARLQSFQPRYGVDITDATLPQETGQTHALHFQKGCYLGQEIVERIRSRGHVNKQLMGFRLEGASAPAAGSHLSVGEKQAGEVTSAAEMPGGRAVGLAYVRVPYDKPGGVVVIDGRPAELFAITA